MLQFALVLGLFLTHAPTTTAVRSSKGLRHRASVAPAWEAPTEKTKDKECTKYAGRWPAATTWASKVDAFKCCKEYNCAKLKKQIDCRQYPVPEGLQRTTWENAMTSVFGAGVLDDALPAGSKEQNAGHRAVSLATLEKIEEAAKKLFPPSGKLKVVNKRFYPEGQDKTYDELTMHDINGLIGMPLAASSHKSFAEHVGGEKPTFFISHNWGGRFGLFVKSAQNHFEFKKLKAPDLDKTKIFYWVCTFA